MGTASPIWNNRAEKPPGPGPKPAISLILQANMACQRLVLVSRVHTRLKARGMFHGTGGGIQDQKMRAYR
jgi:hypothetical protein